MTLFPTGHKSTASDFATLIPIKGVRITSAGNPINSTASTTELDLSKYAMTGLTLVTGRYYIARYLVTFTKSISSDSFDLRLRVNTATTGTQIGRLDVFAQDQTPNVKEYQFVFVGDASYTALYLSAARTAGTGTLSYFGASGGFNRAWGALHDVGDSDNWSDVP